MFGLHYVISTENDCFNNMEKQQTPLDQLIEMRLSRRDAMRTATLAAATVFAGKVGPSVAALQDNKSPGETTLQFSEVKHTIAPDIMVAPGYSTQILLRWGDKVTGDAPEFNVKNQNATAQSKQFGYNNDFVAFLPLPRGSNNSEHGLLCVNHEYTNPELMFSGVTRDTKLDVMTIDQCKVELAAHGHSVVELKRENGVWKVVYGKWNRRITALDTELRISGPVAGHDRMKTKEDATGRTVIGMIGNCAGGVTPWGTILTGEENFQKYFGGEPSGSEAQNYARYQVGEERIEHAWFKYFDRFNVAKEPNTPNRFGWIVEFDPYNPESVAVKRTALGRFRHEGATTAIAADGRMVAYCGDDTRGEYLYRFVSRDKCHPDNRAANRDLLDHGTLYVAKFHADGHLVWLPLVFGEGALTKENRFESQADVLIETRKAADCVGATPMDRPEDAETNPFTGHVFVMLTNNDERKPEDVDGPNPRANNKHGQILELIPPVIGRRIDHAADEFRWDLFLKAGNPDKKEDGAGYHELVSQHGWLSCPDNCTFDNRGRLWIATDGAPSSSGVADGIFACDTNGPGRALTRHFFRGPVGAEICGPCFTPDSKTLFVAVQHPGERSIFADPSTRWPDFDRAMPPRPSVVAISKNDDGVIGS